MLLDENWDCYICDFQLSRETTLASQALVTNANLGTLRYMAPECF